MLGDLVLNARVLDLFAGTGSFGLDALSRGAEYAVFVDESSSALKIIRQNLQNCFKQPEAELIRLNLAKSLAFKTLKNRFAEDSFFNIIFLDPPYEKKMAESTLTMIEKTSLVAAEGVVIAEERWKISLPEKVGILKLQQQRRYGETGIWIYKSETGQGSGRKQ